MIRQFRKVRQQLLSEDKYSTYMLYAAGEVLLVVTGILLALQIDNWNEDRKGRNKEVQILETLYNEFEQNKSVIQSTIGNTEASLKACYTLMDLMNKEAAELSAYNVDSLIYWSIEHRPFNPSNNTFLEIVQTGNIHLIRNKTLKKKLFEWSRGLENNKDNNLYHLSLLLDEYNALEKIILSIIEASK